MAEEPQPAPDTNPAGGVQIGDVGDEIQRSALVGRDVIHSIIATGDHNQFFSGDYERLQDAYVEPWSVFAQVKLDHFAGRHTS